MEGCRGNYRQPEFTKESYVSTVDFTFCLSAGVCYRVAASETLVTLYWHQLQPRLSLCSWLHLLFSLLERLFLCVHNFTLLSPVSQPDASKWKRSKYFKGLRLAGVVWMLLVWLWRECFRQ